MVGRVRHTPYTHRDKDLRFPKAPGTIDLIITNLVILAAQGCKRLTGCNQNIDDYMIHMNSGCAVFAKHFRKTEVTVHCQHKDAKG